MKKQYYTPQETAELLSVHYLTVLDWIKKGRLPALELGDGKRKIYRITIEHLERFNQKNRREIKKNDTNTTKN